MVDFWLKSIMKIRMIGTTGWPSQKIAATFGLCVSFLHRILLDLIFRRWSLRWSIPFSSIDWNHFLVPLFLAPPLYPLEPLTRLGMAVPQFLVLFPSFLTLSSPLGLFSLAAATIQTDFFTSSDLFSFGVYFWCAGSQTNDLGTSESLGALL